MSASNSGSSFTASSSKEHAFLHIPDFDESSLPTPSSFAAALDSYQDYLRKVEEMIPNPLQGVYIRKMPLSQEAFLNKYGFSTLPDDSTQNEGSTPNSQVPAQAMDNSSQSKKRASSIATQTIIVNTTTGAAMITKSRRAAANMATEDAAKCQRIADRLCSAGGQKGIVVEIGGVTYGIKDYKFGDYIPPVGDWDEKGWHSIRDDEDLSGLRWLKNKWWTQKQLASSAEEGCNCVMGSALCTCILRPFVLQMSNWEVPSAG